MVQTNTVTHIVRVRYGRKLQRINYDILQDLFFTILNPFFKFQNNHIPGILFFLSAATMIVSSLLCFLFTETKGKDLEDTMRTSETAGKSSLMTDMKLNPVFTPVNIDDKFKATNEGNIVTKF